MEADRVLACLLIIQYVKLYFKSTISKTATSRKYELIHTLRTQCNEPNSLFLLSLKITTTTTTTTNNNNNNNNNNKQQICYKQKQMANAAYVNNLTRQ